jgi:hypothetical protein
MNFRYFKPDRLILLIIGLSVIFGFASTFIHHFVSELAEPFKNLILYTDSFTVPFFVFLIIFLINKYGWKNSKFKWLIDIPNLNGRYLGKLTSDYEVIKSPNIMDCVIEITQTASEIHIFGYFGDISTNFVSSSSQGISAELSKENNDLFKLYYVFANETSGMPAKFNNHTGTASFNYYPDKKMLDGVYYNKLKNTGTIKVTFQQEALLCRLIP